MTRTSPRQQRSTPADDPWKTAYWACSGLFVAAWIVALLRTCAPIPALQESAWPDAVLVLVTAVTLLLSLARRLPIQNVLLAAAIMGGIGTVTHAVSAATGIPLGPITFTHTAGPQIPGNVSWAIPLLWIIAIVAARGVARLILRPWRKMRTYGFWLIGVTATLCLLLDLGLEPYATRANHYWLWNPTRLPIDWHGTPLTNFVAWALTVLLAMAFATPALIKKRPAKLPPDYGAIVLWIMLNALLTAGAVTTRLWPAAALNIAATLAIVIFAIRGARW